MVIVGLGWLVARALTLRFVPWRPARFTAFTAGALAILAVVVLPAYDDDTVIETFPGAVPTTTAPSAPASSVAPSVTAGPTTTATGTSAASVSPPTTTGPVRVRVGQFRGIDHRAMGTVAVYRQPDGRFVVGLEEFDIQPGPDYDLYVVPGTDREKRDGGTKLDDLKGNRGTQYYEVPAGIDLASGAWSVLVWCQTFGVPVANATPV
jgi:hypothetical protein